VTLYVVYTELFQHLNPHSLNNHNHRSTTTNSTRFRSCKRLHYFARHLS
jgi:hypothetical protein